MPPAEVGGRYLRGAKRGTRTTDFTEEQGPFSRKKAHRAVREEAKPRAKAQEATTESIKRTRRVIENGDDDEAAKKKCSDRLDDEAANKKLNGGVDDEAANKKSSDRPDDEVLKKSPVILPTMKQLRQSPMVLPKMEQRIKS
jgi:hypothetical protein